MHEARVLSYPLVADNKVQSEQYSTTIRSCIADDRSDVASIIADTFGENHGVCWLLKNDGQNKMEIRKLAEFAFIKALNSDGAFISGNKAGVALCYQNSRTRFSIREIWFQLRFVISSVRITHLPEIIKREKYRAMIRSQFKDYLYFWFLGVKPNRENAGFALKNKVIEMARSLKLPLCLETTSERNKKIYERLGFETYHYWENKNRDIKFWFMKMNTNLVNN